MARSAVADLFLEGALQMETPLWVLGLSATGTWKNLLEATDFQTRPPPHLLARGCRGRDVGARKGAARSPGRNARTGNGNRLHPTAG